MQIISFESKIRKIDSSNIVRLPTEASLILPSRGIVAVSGTIDGKKLQTVLEPDGVRGHWFKVSNNLQVGSIVKIGIEPTKEWPEPVVPDDFQTALNANLKAFKLWKEITPMARWDWIRWINSTKQPETRKRRVEVSCSKLSRGMRRPCCFNRTECCDPDVTINGTLPSD